MFCCRFHENPGSSINPYRINSDTVENQFCQQRGMYHGNQANPNYYQFARGTTSIILGQHTVSNKGREIIISSITKNFE